MPIKVLLVDDEKTFTEVLKGRLEKHGFTVAAVHSGLDALAIIEKQEFHVAVLDIDLPDIDGISLLKQIRANNPFLGAIMLTGHGSIESAIESIKLGAHHYLTKPCNTPELVVQLQKAVENRKLAKKVAGLEAMISRESEKIVLIGESPSMIEVKKMINTVADSDASILILGGSGTGKDVVAQALHFNSSRRASPFQVLNSAALSPQLVESELFGHVKGAFTGATTNKLGLVEMADEGTLFLDEIGDMDFNVQSKFLRFLETGEFRRVGENKLRTVKVRVIAATNKDLNAMVVANEFREDLFYRLNVVVIYMPSLQERTSDIPLLVNHFLKNKFNSEKKLSSEAKKRLMEYNFPGNVRELINIIERGILLSGAEEIMEYHHMFPAYDEMQIITDKSTEKENLLTLREMEQKHIIKALEHTDNNKTQAARLLGIGLKTLYRKLEEMQ